MYSLRERMSATLTNAGQVHYENWEEAAVPTVTVTFLSPLKRSLAKWLWKRSMEKGKIWEMQMFELVLLFGGLMREAMEKPDHKPELNNLMASSSLYVFLLPKTTFCCSLLCSRNLHPFLLHRHKHTRNGYFSMCPADWLWRISQWCSARYAMLWKY